MKKLIVAVVCAAAVGFACGAQAEYSDDYITSAIRYVKPDGDATKDGTGGWESATTLAHALETCQSGDEIWALAGNYPVAETVSVSGKGFVLRGGFAGTETYACERTAGARSVLNGGKTTKIDMSADVPDGSTAEIDGFCFTEAYENGFKKSGSGGLTLRNCDFTANNWRPDKNATVYGLGAWLVGGASASLNITNCTFAGNRIRNSAYSLKAQGCGAYVQGFGSFVMEDTLFKTNGIVTGEKGGRDGMRGGALYVDGVVSTLRRCDFVGNTSPGHSNADTGGIIVFNGNCDGSAIENCAFVGSSSFNCLNNQQARNSTVYIGLGGTSQTLTFDRCTFAWNILPAVGGASGIQVAKGALVLRNSIFYGNANRSIATVGADVHVTSGSSLDIDHCWFAEDSAKSVTCAGTLVGKTNCTYGDPLFATAFADVKNMLNGSLTSSAVPQMEGTFYYKANADFDSLDWHLRSTKGRWTGFEWAKDEETSSAIDAGDPEADYGQEPAPNGSCVNLGAYGNTAEASLSPSGLAEMTLGKIDQEHDYSQPHLTVDFGGSEAYQAEVVLCAKVGSAGEDGTTEGWDIVRTVRTGVTPDTSVEFGLGDYFLRGENVYWQVLATTKGGTAVLKGESPIEIVNDRPPWYGKSGGANVVHVWAERTGAGTGENWHNACTTLKAALDIVAEDPTKTEIWIAGDLVEGATASPGRPLAIRGGFAGGETEAAARTVGARSAIDGNKTADPLTLSSSAALELDGLLLRNGYEHGLNRTGTGALNVHDCDFVANCWRGNPEAWANVYGLGARFTGSGELSVRNCTFAGNKGRNASYNLNPKGCGMYVSGFSSATVDSCLFVTNGVDLTDVSSGRAGMQGAAFYLDGVKATVRNCQIRANASNTRNDSDSGGVVTLAGNCSGTVIRNCAFVGNTCGYTFMTTRSCNATVYVNLDSAARQVGFENCTFAFNAMAGTSSATGIQTDMGTVTVRNSIFYGNMSVSSSTYGSDIHVAGGSTNDIDYCLFEGSTTTNLTAASTAVLKIGNHNVFDNPYFVTEKDEVTAKFASGMALVAGTFSRVTMSDNKVQFAKLDSGVGFNVHLRGGLGYYDETTGGLVTDYMGKPVSPAIDAGDPKASRKNERRPHGPRVNLGAYGNTPWATMSNEPGLLLFVR